MIIRGKDIDNSINYLDENLEAEFEDDLNYKKEKPSISLIQIAKGLAKKLQGNAFVLYKSNKKTLKEEIISFGEFGIITGDPYETKSHVNIKKALALTKKGNEKYLLVPTKEGIKVIIKNFSEMDRALLNNIIK